MTNNILEIISEGAKWLTIGGGTYLGAMGITSFASGLLSKKIRNKKELGIILEEEASKLGLNNKNISARFGLAEGHVGEANKLGNKNYEIVLDSFGQDKSCLKHELYHIYRGDCEGAKYNKNLKSFIKYLFLEEPRAVLYESFGIKL